MYHNDFEKYPRGIIVYVDCRFKSKQLFLNSKAVEHLIINTIQICTFGINYHI